MSDSVDEGQRCFDARRLRYDAIESGGDCAIRRMQEFRRCRCLRRQSLISPATRPQSVNRRWNSLPTIKEAIPLGQTSERGLLLIKCEIAQRIDLRIQLALRSGVGLNDQNSPVTQWNRNG
jgi:hypothetical protein